MAYILGFFTADGSMAKNKRGAHFIEIEITDKELLEEIRTVLGSNHKITARDRNKKCKISYRLQIGSKEIFSDLLFLGITPCKSKTIRLPKVPNKYFPHFVRGYFDGDGNAIKGYYSRRDRKSKKSVFLTRFISGSKLFIVDLQGRLSDLAGIKGFIYEGDGAWVLNYSIKESEKIFHFMYPLSGTCETLFLKRKKKIFDSFFAKC